MAKCASCGYEFEASKLKTTATGGYCRVCVAIGAPHVNENPNAFGESKYFIPPLAWCTNYILAAISTRAAASEADVSPASLSSEEGLPAFIVLSEDGQMVEVQDAEGKPIELNNARFSEVEGTSFKKFGVVLPLR